MMHTKTTYYCIYSLLLLFSYQIQSSKKTMLHHDIQTWNKLAQEQNCCHRTLHFIPPCIQTTHRYAICSLATTVISRCCCPEFVTGEPGTPPEIQLFICPLYMKSLLDIYQQECVKKPQQYQEKQNQIRIAILEKYSARTITKAAGSQHPLSIEAQQIQRMK